MKYIIITLYVCMSFFINCSSVQRYAYNRGLDFLDIFHLGVEKNIYGVSANVDSLVVGLQYRKESKGFGSRYGCLGFYSSSKKVKIYGHVKWTHYSFKIIENVGNSNFINNTEYHESMSNLKRCKHKKINQFIFTLLNDRYSQINECQKTENCIVNSDVRRISYSFLPIELSLGAHYGIRIGINTSEFVDFIYGIFGADLHDDDIGSLEWEFGDAFKAPTKPLNLDKPIDSIPKIINYKKDKKELVDKLTKYSKDLEKDEEYILPDKKKEKDKKWFWEKYR